MPRNLILLLAFLIIGRFASADASADDNASRKNETEGLREQGYSVKAISPVFGQLVVFSLPKGFNTVYEETKGLQYIRESVLNGENVKKWSQMITLTGAKGLAANPNLTPQAFANSLASGFRKACPASFNGSALGAFKIGIHDAFAAVLSCGVTNPTGELYSESMLLIAIKGESDFYTLQWAERSSASTTPIKFDEAKWTARFKRLAPIKLCPIVPGEQAPYPNSASSANCVGA
jgi:hypothetical protein